MDITFKISGITVVDGDQEVKLDDVEVKAEKVTKEDIESLLREIPEFVHNLAESIEDFVETIAESKELLEQSGLGEMLEGLKSQFEQSAPTEGGKLKANATTTETFKFTSEPKKEEKPSIIASILADVENEVNALLKEQEQKEKTQHQSPMFGGMPVGKLTPEQEALFEKLFGK